MIDYIIYICPIVSTEYTELLPHSICYMPTRNGCTCYKPS